MNRSEVIVCELSQKFSVFIAVVHQSFSSH